MEICDAGCALLTSHLSIDSGNCFCHLHLLIFFLWSFSSCVCIQITLNNGVAYIEWTANPVTDMYADAVIAVILRAEQDPMPMKSERSVKVRASSCIL